MMELQQYDIRASRGDTLSLRLDIAGDMPEGSRVLFTVRQNPGDLDFLVEKEYVPDAENGVNLYLSAPEMDRAPGLYWWDVRLVLPGEGGPARVVTPFQPAKFEIVEVVGHVTSR